MSKKWRRFEVLLPVRYNDGKPIPRKVVGEAVKEFVTHFGAASYQPQPLEGYWVHRGVLFRDRLTRLVVDVPDTLANRTWMKRFKARWKARLQQVELWLVSYRIEID